MKLVDLTWLVEAILQWVDCLFNPIKNINRLLRALADENTLAPLVKLWTPPLVFSVILNICIFQLYGIPFNDYGFQISSCLIYLIFQMIAPYLMHAGFCFSRLKSDLRETAAMYSVVIFYGPAVTFITAPSSTRLYTFIQNIKALKSSQNLEFMDAVNKLFPEFIHTITIDKGFSIYTISTFISIAVTLLTLATFSECAAQRYSHDRYSTYYSINFVTLWILAVSVLIQYPLQLSIFYIFLN
jgi:hypothetical protein